MKNKYIIYINEGDTIFGTGLRVLLSHEPDLEIIDDSGTAAGELQIRIAQIHPDLLIIDLYDHGNSNLDKIAEIKQTFPQTRILLITQHANEQSIRASLCAGVSGYVLKDASNSELRTAVRSVLEGKVYLSPSLSDDIINAFLLSGRQVNIQSRLETLTRRELEILKMVAEGHTNRSVADKLSLSIKTVEKHRSNMMKKLDLHNASALTTFAIGQGLVITQE